MPLRPWSRRHWSSPFMPFTAGPPDRPSFDAVASSKVSCPVRRVLARCIRSLFFPSDIAFATDGWLGALQVFPQATSRGPQLSTLQAFPSITTVSFTCPPGRSHAVTRVEGFVARACLGFVSFSQVEPVIRLNRPISGAGFAPASHRVLLAAPAGRWNDWPADSWMLHPLPSKPLRQVMRATTTSLICLRRAASVGSTITVGYFRDCYAKGRFRRDR